MDVMDAIKGRRSQRAFEQRSVDSEKIDAILEAACWAPSPANSQPWEFVLITGDETKQKLLDMAQTARDHGSIAIHGYSYVRPLPFASVEEETEARTEALKGYSLLFIRDVPVVIGVVGLASGRVRAAEGSAGEDAYKYACAAAIQNMLLAAHSLGLGSLWFTLFDENQVARFFNLGEGKRLIALVCVGYPAGEPPRAPERIPASAKTTHLDS